MDRLHFLQNVASSFPLNTGFVEMLNNLPLTPHSLGRRVGLQMVGIWRPWTVLHP